MIDAAECQYERRAKYTIINQVGACTIKCLIINRQFFKVLNCVII